MIVSVAAAVRRGLANPSRTGASAFPTEFCLIGRHTASWIADDRTGCFFAVVVLTDSVRVVLSVASQAKADTA